MPFDRTIDIGTDVAALFVFHPDDLTHRADNPLDWYDYDFACSKEFRAGNLIVFGTGADGGYQMRLTDGNLTEAEQERETGSWEFGYMVRHGRVLVDNGDFLPSEEARKAEKADADSWVEIPNGDYRVTVHPIEREDDTLPDYVLCFAMVEDPLALVKSPTAPRLAPFKETPPEAMQGVTAELSPSTEKPIEKNYPVFVAEERYALPGGSVSLNVSEEIYNAVINDDERVYKDNYFYAVLAPTDAVPCLATTVWVNGASWSEKDGFQIRAVGRRLVRVTQIIAVKPGDLLPTAHIEAVTPPEDTITADELAALKKAFADSETKTTGFERERVEAMKSSGAVTLRLIELVEMPIGKRFELLASSNRHRLEGLTALLTTG